MFKFIFLFLKFVSFNKLYVLDIIPSLFNEFFLRVKFIMSCLWYPGHENIVIDTHKISGELVWFQY